MPWEALAERIADALKAGQATESMIARRINAAILPTEILRAALLAMQKRGFVERANHLEWRLVGSVCTKCHDLKLLHQFPCDKSRQTGRHPWCKQCLAAAVKAIYWRKKRAVAQSISCRSIPEDRAHA